MQKKKNSKLKKVFEIFFFDKLCLIIILLPISIHPQNHIKADAHITFLKKTYKIKKKKLTVSSKTVV